MTRQARLEDVLAAPAEFWSNVQVTPACWLWMGSHTDEGYGKFLDWFSHRIAFLTHRGEIPEGLQLDHLCRVRNCVNPDHLEPVTAAVNAQRAAAVRTHCPHGHEYTEDNTYYEPLRPGRVSRSRHCRTCRRVRHRAQYRAEMVARVVGHGGGRGK